MKIIYNLINIGAVAEYAFVEAKNLLLVQIKILKFTERLVFYPNLVFGDSPI